MAEVFFASHEITVYRAKNRGSDKVSLTATFTAHNADIQPAGTQRTQDGSLRIGQQWIGFVGVDVDIKEGDQIVTGGRRYSVKGVSRFSGAGLLDHRELLLESVNG